MPHERFTAAGFEIVVATPRAAVPVADEAGFTEAMNGGSPGPGCRFRAYLDSVKDQLEHPQALEDQSADTCDLVLVPGGHAPMEDLESSPEFGRLVAAFVAGGKSVAAVCHGPAALLRAVAGDGSWLFAGRRVTGFSNAE